MNNINRPVVKQQAKTIIKNKVFYLFLISIIVIFLSGTSLGTNTNLNFNNNDFELFRQNNSSDEYQENEDDYSIWDNPIEDFEFNSSTSSPEATPLSLSKNIIPKVTLGGVNGLSFIVGMIFYPLNVTLAGMYLALVRRRPDEQFSFGSELGGIFKNSFNDTYLKKLIVVLLRDVFLLLLSILFVVPGIVFYYSSYFSNQIMSDNPNLKPSEAIKLSKKIIKGNRTELFALSLSFIPWYLLCAVTCGIAAIYVIPYVETTKALYYENFRMRALQEGRITADDFLSLEEKMAGFGSAGNATGNNSTNYYSYADFSGSAGNNFGASYYYSPQQSEPKADNTAPQPPQSYYYTAPEAQENTDSNNDSIPPQSEL